MRTGDCGRVYVMGALLLTVPLLLAFHGSGFAEGPQSGSQKRWKGPDGHTLPFSTDSELCDFLKTSMVRDIQKVPTGVTKPRKLLLERDGVTAHAIFHYRHSEGREGKLAREYVKHIRDSYLNQVAAYEMSYLLGFTNVPPTVSREIDGEKGSVQLWIENAMTEKKRREKGVRPPNLTIVNRYTDDMRVFDYLINNIDRHQDNILYDPNWQLWLIDHTRAFGRDHSLLNRNTLRRCSRSLWARIQSLDNQTITQVLEPYMGRKEVEAVFTRRKRILKRLKEQIRKEGEEAVLFDYSKP